LIEQTRQAEVLRTASYRKALEWAGDSEERLHRVAQARGYRKGWVYYRLKELKGAAA